MVTFILGILSFIATLPLKVALAGKEVVETKKKVSRVKKKLKGKTLSKKEKKESRSAKVKIRVRRNLKAFIVLLKSVGFVCSLVGIIVMIVIANGALIMYVTAYFVVTTEINKPKSDIPIIITAYEAPTFETSFIGNSEWVDACDDVAQWYVANAGEYSQSKTLSCPLIDGTSVRLDCSSYVSACLIYSGLYKGNIVTSRNFTATSGRTFDLLSENFNYYNIKDPNYKPKAGDIVSYNGHVEIIASFSNSEVKVYGWGKAHDVEPYATSFKNIEAYLSNTPQVYGKDWVTVWQQK